MARPRKEIDQNQLESLCRLNPTLKDVAAFFQCSEDTVERRCAEYGYKDFADARQQNMVHTRLGVIRKAVEMANNGNVPMLIFTLKNLCGWADKQESTVGLDKETTNALKLNYALPDADK